MSKEEWKKAIHLVEYREPKPNAHKWKYVGRTPQGGLSGGDDVHKCTLCGKYDSDPWSWNSICQKASEGGDTEIFTKYTRDGDIIERAIVGKHMIIREGKKVTIIDKANFDQFYRIDSETYALDEEKAT